MRSLRCVLAVLLTAVPVSEAGQQSISWTKDHIYAGAGGKEIAVVTPIPSDTTAPTTPTNLGTSNVTATSVRLTWTGSTDSGNSGLAGYKVYRQRGSGASIPVGTLNASTTTFVDEPLQASTSYTYTVRAYDNAQNHSSASNSSSVTTAAAWYGETEPPSTPLNLQGWATSYNALHLQWNASTDTGGSGVAGYKVYSDGTLISGTTPIATTTYDDTALAELSHVYTIKAVDNAGNISNPTPDFQILQLLYRNDFSVPDQHLPSGFWIQSGKAMCWAGGNDNPHCTESWTIAPPGRIRATVSTFGWAGISFWDSNNGRYQVVTDGGTPAASYCLTAA